LWVIIALAGLAAVIVLVLCVPLGIVFRLDVYGKPRFRLRLEWLFGLVHREIKKGKKKPEKKKKAVEGKPKPGRRRVDAKLVLKLVRTKGLPGQIKKLLADIFRLLKIRDFGADLRMGLDNPADTALFFAVVAPVNLFLGSTFPRRLRLQPSFNGGALFEGYLYGAVKLRPIQLIVSILWFVFSLPALRVMRTLVWSKWKRKK